MSSRIFIKKKVEVVSLKAAAVVNANLLPVLPAPLRPTICQRYYSSLPRIAEVKTKKGQKVQN
jgi:hypothetical protein